MDTHWCSVLVRFFQAGAGLPDARGVTREFDYADYIDRFKIPIQQLIQSVSSEISSITVIANGDTQYPLGEAIGADGYNASVRAIRDSFSREIHSGLMRTIVDTAWGSHVGSAHALDVGWRTAVEADSTEFVLSYNPEASITREILSGMLQHLVKYRLDFVGAYREGYEIFLPWQFPQNTICLYRKSVLREADGFSVRCDGNDGGILSGGSAGTVKRSGMEDFDLMLRLFKDRGTPPRWGMVCKTNPLAWQTQFGLTTRDTFFKQKLERQLLIMREWIRYHFPNSSYDEIFEALKKAQIDS